MGVLTTTTTKTKLLQYRRFECLGPAETFQFWNSEIKTSVDNAKISRVRPAEPLFLHPTELPKQYTKVDRWGYYKVSSKVPVSYTTCAGLPFTVLRDSYNGNIGAGLPQGIAPNTNWELYARLRVKDMSVNLAQPLHEYRESAKMFYGAAKGIKEAWETYRAARRFRWRISPCAVPASHLMATYGIEPLVRTVFDSVIQLQGRFSDPIYRRFSVLAGAKQPVNTGVYLGEWEVSERAIFYVEYIPEDYSNFTLGNPIELAWETVPFSFVVDWMIPIGDYLSALDALKEVKSLTGTLTRKEHYHHIKTLSPIGTPWIRQPSLTYDSHERTVLSTIPMPRVPTWSPSDSYRKIANGLALLGSLKCSRR